MRASTGWTTPLSCPVLSGHSKPMARKTLQLGRHVLPPASPAKAQLDRVPNPHPDTNYVARFTAPEFTTLCKITGQPDFAHLVIDYVPARWLLESKSLKLYLTSFRNRGRLPRGLHGRHRQAALRALEAEMAAHRRLLVSARRHPHRRVLAGRPLAQGPMGARPGRLALSRARLHIPAIGIGCAAGAASISIRRGQQEARRRSARR